MNNKWLKWGIGLGGISAFTLFLQSIDTYNEKKLSNGYFVDIETQNIINPQDCLSVNKEEREQQLLALDWDEGNWDVEFSNGAIIATPNSEIPYLNRAEQRTMRS